MIHKNSVEVFVVDAVICCPAEHIDAGRKVASEYMRTLNVTDWEPDKMLPVPLSPTGEMPVTHFACHQQCHNDDLVSMAAWIANSNAEYMTVSEKTLWGFLNESGLKIVS